MIAERQFLDFVAGIFEMTADALTMETAYESIPQWDSVMHLRLVMEVQSEFNVDIPLEEIPTLDTLGKVYSYLNK